EEQKRREAEHNSREKRIVLEKQYKEKIKLKEEYDQIEKTKLVRKQKELLIVKEKEEEEEMFCNYESLITQEVKRIKEKKANKEKTAIEILFQDDQSIEFPKITIEKTAKAKLTPEAEMKVYIPQVEDKIVEDIVEQK
ncbi:2261_t:CDS:2, partial [Scutellospora calospora]